MTEFDALFQSRTKLLSLLFDYNRIPVRVVDKDYHVRYSSFDIEPFRRIAFQNDIRARLFQKENLQPVLCAVNSLELISCFPFDYAGGSYYLVIGPALLTRPYSGGISRALRFFPSLDPADLEKLANAIPVVSITPFAGYVRLLYTAFTGCEISRAEH